MPLKQNWRLTMVACFLGSVSQATVSNFAPLLFLTFQSSFGISLGEVTLLITLNFLVQLTVDLISVSVVDKIGYRPCLCASQLFTAAGLAGLAVLPRLLPAFPGLLTAVFLYAVGGGLVEVLVTPAMEGCPTKNKAAAISLLHSFYCWGQMGVVLLSTGFFVLFGTAYWPVLAFFWALLPFTNAFLFLRAPLNPPAAAGSGVRAVRMLFASRLFWIFILLMFASGATELSMAQWASAFAESGLGVSKAVGDLLGPCLFGGCMGLARLFFAKSSHIIPLKRYMAASGLLCLLTYLTIALSPLPALSLAACAATGLGVGILWPGCCSLASAALPGGGTALFALLALAGDIGCTIGPTAVGFIADRAGGSLRIGLSGALIFPLLLLAGLVPLLKSSKRRVDDA